MIRCLCCNQVIANPTEYERKVLWHEKCIKSFFGTKQLPELDCTGEELERLANLSVNKGFTVPGVQKKLSLHLENGEKASRLTIVDYPTGFILKPQSEEYAFLPEAEFLVMKMAETVRIKAVPNALIRLDGKYAYITKRIDRANGQLYAMEDFCQLSGRMTADKYRSSYENCAKVVKKYADKTGLELTELFYRLLFCFITGNSDMHLKNFSLIEDQPGSRRFSLSPVYDMLPVNLILPADREQMALSLHGKKRNIKRKDFLLLAENMGIHEKAAAGMIRKMLSYRHVLIDEVKISYLSDEMKEKLAELIEERSEVLTSAPG